MAAWVWFSEHGPTPSFHHIPPDSWDFIPACPGNTFGNIRVWGSNLRQKSVWVNLIEEQIADLVRSLKLPLDWDREVRKILQEKDGGPDPVIQRKEIREQLRRMRIGYERGMYNDEEHVFWREVESLQEKMNRLEHPQADAINRAAKTLLNLREIWENSTREEQRELAQMMLQEVGCSVFEKRVVWIKPRMGFEILFQLVGDLRPAEIGRFWLNQPVEIRDIRVPKAKVFQEGLTIA